MRYGFAVDVESAAQVAVDGHTLTARDVTLRFPMQILADTSYLVKVLRSFSDSPPSWMEIW